MVHLVLLPGKKHTAAAAAKAKKQYTLIPAASQPRRTNGQTGRISHSIRPAGAAAAETPTASAAPSMSATNSAPSRVAPWSHASAAAVDLSYGASKMHLVGNHVVVYVVIHVHVAAGVVAEAAAL